MKNSGKIASRKKFIWELKKFARLNRNKFEENWKFVEENQIWKIRKKLQAKNKRDSKFCKILKKVYIKNFKFEKIS